MKRKNYENENQSLEEMYAQMYVDTYKFVQNSTLKLIGFYEEKCKMLKQELIILEEKKPLRLFKTLYKNWENTKKRITKEYDKTYNDLLLEYKELEDMI